MCVVQGFWKVPDQLPWYQACGWAELYRVGFSCDDGASKRPSLHCLAQLCKHHCASKAEWDWSGEGWGEAFENCHPEADALFLLFLFCRCECFESFSFDFNASFMLQWATLNSDSNRLNHPNSIVLRHVLAMWPCCDMNLRINRIRRHPLLRTSLMEMKRISHLSSHSDIM